MPNIANAVRTEVQEAVAKDQLDLPTLPEVALRIRETARDENVSGAALAEVTSIDPSLAAQLVKVANSPMFRGAMNIEDLQSAIARLGVVYAANLAVGLAIKQMFQATSEVVDRILRATWSHACDVAAISGLLAKKFTNIPPDHATLAGLTHSIGTLPILTFAEQHERLIRDGLTLTEVIESLHGSLGTMILHNWGFSPELVMVPSGYTTFDRTTELPDLVDVVMIANLHTLHNTGHPYDQLDWSRIGAFTRVGINPDPDAPELEEFMSEVSEARQAFT